MTQVTLFSEDAAKRLATSLKQVLADTYILYVKTQNFHWNVEGPYFYSLHKFFEHQYEDLADAVDLIAERIRTLDERAPGTMREFLEMGTLQESDSDSDAQEMIRRLWNDHKALSNMLHSKIKEAQEIGDEATVDIYIERLRDHDKTAWMLQSHLKKIINNIS